MVDEKDLIQKIQEFFQHGYEGGSRWLGRAKEIAGICLARSNSHKPGNPCYPYYQILVNLTCSFLSQATDWQDFRRRDRAVFDAFQQGRDNSNITYHRNPAVQKTVAEVFIRFLSAGLPQSKDWNILNNYASLFFGIPAAKDSTRASYVEEEVPTEELVPVQKGWLFKREVIEKRIVMKKVKKKIPTKRGIPKTAEELIQELSRFA
ncbi:hypothetical protein KY338_00190 [Candidatus Woesearchaeota archaeon]|nr:hypothetical protein [Candidatus Woesearchaeota archaeon]MBW3005259.1 hypothetical protein [Candidatus Woesearchaeota archaeon]